LIIDDEKPEIQEVSGPILILGIKLLKQEILNNILITEKLSSPYLLNFEDIGLMSTLSTKVLRKGILKFSYRRC